MWHLCASRHFRILPEWPVASSSAFPSSAQLKIRLTATRFLVLSSTRPHRPSREAQQLLRQLGYAPGPRNVEQGKHQNPWGQSSRHRRLNVQPSTSNAHSPFRRKTVSPFDPTDFSALLPDSIPRSAGTAEPGREVLAHDDAAHALVRGAEERAGQRAALSPGRPQDGVRGGVFASASSMSLIL